MQSYGVDQVFIVMQESIYDGSTHWDIDRVFSSMQSAEAYIAHRKAQARGYYDRPEFEIEVEEVYA